MGKALLSQLPDRRVREILARTGMAEHTPNTFTAPDALLAELERIRPAGLRPGRRGAGDRRALRRGAAARAPTLTAISVSGPSGRMTRETVPDVVPIMRDAADRFAKELGPTA